MITFITALYQEAKPLIQNLQLKKHSSETLYQFYEGDQIRLLITGTGNKRFLFSMAHSLAEAVSNIARNIERGVV